MTIASQAERGADSGVGLPAYRVGYWMGVGLVAAGFFVTRLLPCVDYPQHLALSDIARRLQDPAAPEHAQFQLNYFTYNGLFHFVVATLSSILPIELAGRLVVAGSVVATAWAVVALLRELGRPPEYAALFTPALFSFSLGFGFANYVLATAIATWALVAIARGVARPSAGGLAVVAALGLACGFAHVLAMLVLCLAGLALAGELAWRQATVHALRAAAHGTRISGGARLARAIARAGLALAPLTVGCLFCIAVYRRQYEWDPNMYRDPTIEGSAPPVWQKLALFSAYTTDLFRDATDQILLWVALAGMVWAVHVARRARRAGGLSLREASAPLVAPFATMVLAYLATPMVFVGTHLIFPRLGQWVVLGAALATPRLPPLLAARARVWLPRLGVVVGANALLHCALFAWETSDASATIDDLPDGGAATALVWEPATASFRNVVLTHLAGYYAARKHGTWAFAFARYLSVPVRFKVGSQHSWPPVGWEYDPRNYDPRCPYARLFPLVIVKAPSTLSRDAAGEAAVRSLVFHDDAPLVTLLSHHGRYWAFDSAAVPERVP
ncbi:MAG TPA: hypothetical protein VH044_00265 [Polyangiaceae bacterium]|nr:hypothetical protein [Polyangiaceae bacterium]